MPESIDRMNVQSQRGHVPRAGTARPPEEWQCRFVERIDNKCVQLCCEFAYGLPRPVIQRIELRIAFRLKSAEHRWSRIADQNYDFGFLRNLILRYRLEGT